MTDILESSLGSDHPDVAETLDRQGVMLEKQVGAVRMFQEIPREAHSILQRIRPGKVVHHLSLGFVAMISI